MKLRELIENSDPDVDFDQFCMDNIGALFTAAIDGDSDDLATIAPVDSEEVKSNARQIVLLPTEDQEIQRNRLQDVKGWQATLSPGHWILNGGLCATLHTSTDLRVAMFADTRDEFFAIRGGAMRNARFGVETANINVVNGKNWCEFRSVFTLSEQSKFNVQVRKNTNGEQTSIVHANSYLKLERIN